MCPFVQISEAGFDILKTSKKELGQDEATELFKNVYDEVIWDVIDRCNFTGVLLPSFVRLR